MSDIISLFSNWLHKSRTETGREGGPAPAQPDTTSSTELNYLQEITFKVNAQGQWVFLNNKWQQYTGYSTEECLGKNWLNHIHPQDHDTCREYLRRVSKGKPDSLAAPIRIITKANELRWMEMRATILPSNSDKTFRLIGTLTDISAEKSENERQLANYRALFSLVNNIPGMVYRCRYNRDWTMEFVSAGCTTLTGYDANQVINNKSAWNDLIHPEAREYVWMTIQSAIKNQQPFELTYRIITRDGSEKWIWERGQGNFSANGELLGLEGLITDITDNKRQSLRIERDSLFDPFTQLATPHLFLNRIQHALERAKAQPGLGFCVLNIHISQHATPSHELTPAQNDQLAKDIGARLKNILSPSATVCRLRDSEFGIIIELGHAPIDKTIRKTARSIQSSLNAPIKLDQSVVYTKSSIGIAQYNHQASNSDLLREANRAMIQAKELGGNRIEFADEQQNTRLTAVLGTENELHKALEEQQLKLLCLPLATSAQSRENALQLKLAWAHPRRGLLQAEDFFDHIEDQALMRKLGKLILQQATAPESPLHDCEQASQVYIHGLGELVLSGELLSETLEKLGRLQNPQVSFILEIDDHQLSGITEAALNNLRQLPAHQIGIAATGLEIAAPYADTLQLPGIRAIKLNMANTPVSQDNVNAYNALIACYHALNISVIAEGVDTPEISDAIQASSFDYLQGREVSSGRG